MKRITLVLKSTLEHLPPILSLCKILNDLGCSLSVICDGISQNEKDDFAKRGIKTTVLPQAADLPTKMGKIYKWLYFRHQAWKALRENPADVYWIGSADTVLALGKKVLSLPYILHIHELYDTNPLYRNRLGIYMNHALKVFVPEEVRAHIFRAWYQLKRTPYVLPNKPYGHPGKRNLPISDPAAREAFEKIPENAKILFYQGWIDKDRDVGRIADAVNEFDGKVVLALQGKVLDQEYAQRLRSKHCYFIPFVNPPCHLEITSHMNIGLLTYDHISQNNEFCAPNKIWEYTGFGLPVLTNDVYSLKKTLEQYEMGAALNLNSMTVPQIKEQIQVLLDHEEQYSHTALKFFNSMDIPSILMRELNGILADTVPGNKA